MNNILILHNKHCDIYFDASTPKKELEAYYMIFRFQDEVNNYYWDMANYKPPEFLNEYDSPAVREEEENKRLHELYLKAKSGNRKAAREIVKLRYDYEYEKIESEGLYNPFSKKDVKSLLGDEEKP